MDQSIKLLAMHGIKNFINRLMLRQPQQKVSYIKGPDNVLNVINSTHGKALILNFKSGASIKAAIVRVLNNTHIIVESKNLFGSKIDVFPLSEIASILLVQ